MPNREDAGNLGFGSGQDREYGMTGTGGSSGGRGADGLRAESDGAGDRGGQRAAGGTGGEGREETARNINTVDERGTTGTGGSTTGRTRGGSRSGRSNRGFASMDPAKQREIASKGGRAAHEKGTAHEFDSNEARQAGRKGGEVVSRNREHMAMIGRRGGESRGANRNRSSQNQNQQGGGGNEADRNR
ncbi:MAG TPA: KGG domain-containing protein [Gemmatimonadaceae bacterium]|nr:KGG domain-containing protein [Gemmatimonadaceae bacterium]